MKRALFKAGVPKWKQPPWKWKNLRCPTCLLWINREKITEHAQTPVHVAAAAAKGRIVRPERAA